MNHTPNYQLSQWAKSDRVLMDDFNADNEKIDAALAGMPKIITGSYTGNGEENRTIPLPFTPKAVFLCAKNGRTVLDDSAYNHYVYGGLAVTGGDVVPWENMTALALCPNGFQVFCANSPTDKAVQYHVLTNGLNVTLHYIAFG